MMQRVPEPELMDSEAQAQAYAEGDFEIPHGQFIQRFRQIFAAWPGQGRVLDLGCGPADITLRFADAYPGCRIDGVDGAEAMLRLGREATRELAMEDRVNLHHCHLPAALPASGYHAIISNSLLHHMFDPMDFWRALRQAGSPGAPVLVMDLLRPDSPQQAARLTQQYAADEPEVLRHDFYHSLFAAYTVEEVQNQLLRAGLLGWGAQQCSDRHWFVAGYLP